MDRVRGDPFLHLLGDLHSFDGYPFVEGAVRIDRVENRKEESFHRDIASDRDSRILYFTFVCAVLAESDIKPKSNERSRTEK